MLLARSDCPTNVVHMTGANLSKLLDTANTSDIVNYDRERHGRGLLDLDEATTSKAP